MKHYQDMRSTNPIVNSIYDQWQKFRIICLTMGRDLSHEEHEYCREPSEGRPLVELINIFAEFTTLSAGIDSVDQSNHEACQKLLDACLAQRNSLLKWYAQRIKSIGGGPLISIDEFCCTDIDPVDVIFGRPYSFVSLDNATLHVFYWIAMVIVSPMIYRAQTFVRSLEHGSKFRSDYVSDPDHLLVAVYADEVIRAVPFFAQDKNKLLGPHMVMFWVAAACKAYINLGTCKKFDWCQKTLGSFGHRGFESCLHYRGYAWDYWNPMNSCTADPFLPASVRNELKSGSPSFESEDQVSDMSEYGQSPFVNCVEWVSSERDLANYTLENSLLEDSWQKGPTCYVATR
ncbi:uncharacterized protein N7473_002327 [Penicillium subrubescens]|uniref:uncharacterized protein n=1 Tax=Penicillium subrubescens TaxID=1316194 RepID=UPI002544E4A1|nr:uncharacterized protein N7473_002327 [Penicillium subrubescens]KAJ5905411.1 hypothetical protein N7473_002327 [Penicillium subrubescens]